MKKVTLMLIAALMAVVSFAGTPLRKASPLNAKKVTVERQIVPQRKAVRTHSLPTTTPQTQKVKKAIRKASPRKVASIDELAGEWMLCNFNYDYDDEEGLVEAELAMSGRPVTFTKAGEATILITGFTPEAEEDITATVDFEEGTLTIADGQKLLDSDYGSVVLSNAMEEGEPLVATILEDGTIDMSDAIWCTVLGDGDYAGYMWDDYFYSSSFALINGQMTWPDTDDNDEPIEAKAPLYILQELDAPQVAYVFNFADEGGVVAIDMKEDNKFEITPQPIADYGSTYGVFSVYGLTDDGEDFLPLTGTGAESTLTFDCNWTLYAPETGYWYGILAPATIAYTDGTEFVFPVIEDVAAMPADPEITFIGAYEAAKDYGYVMAIIPNYDVDYNLIKESKLFYTLYADIAGEITPIVFTPELYKNLTEEMTEIPYSFNDSYDFNVSDGQKIVYLNYDFSNYDRIGVQSIYYGGGETNKTEIQWIDNEKPEINGEFTFDFNSMDVETSGANSTAGDITEELTLTEGSVVLTVSPKEEGVNTENRFWNTGNGPQLRVYSGTLTFAVPEGYSITSITFNAGKWNDGNSADSGEFGEYADNLVTWTGEAQTVVVNIAANTQINNIVVTVGDGEGGGEIDEEELVVLPEGIEPEAWAIEGTYTDSNSANDYVAATQVAFDGNTIYVQGLAYYFKEAWLKGTLVDGIATFPSGQYVGEDQYGKEYMIGSDDGETICDIQFTFDPEAKTLTQLTPYIVENGDTKDELSYYGYWTDVLLYEGEPIIIDPVTPPADLATTTYLFKSMMEEYEYEDEEEEEAVKAYATAKPYEEQVLVGFDGDDIYIQGLAMDLPEGWVKGTKNDDGKYVIPANQYMGTLSVLFYTFNYYFTAVDEENNLIDAILTVDPETGVISSDQTLALNGNKKALDYYVLYTNVNMTEMQEIAAVPADPEIVAFTCTEETKYPMIKLYIPAKSVNGEDLIKAKMAYQLFIVKDGEEQPLVLAADLYEYAEEDMSIIPYSYDDSYDIYKGGEVVYLNQDRDEILSWTKIGVKSINYAGGETNESNIVWFDLEQYYADPDGIAGIATNGNARYFDLTGRVANANQKGLLIKQERQEDGSVKTIKLIRK